VRNGATWIQRAKLVASDGAQSDYFGIEVCLNADTAVVGAFLDDDNGTDSGSAYLFVRAGTTWVQQAKLLASDGAAGDYFGRAVSVSGETALLGAWGDDDNGSYSGSAYVFARVGPFWTQQAKLRASDGSAFDYFGRGLSLSADAAVVGALGDDDNGVTSGSAYIFMRKGVNWTQVQKFLPSDGDSVDSLGRSVCTSGDVVVIGAELDEQTAIDAGSAYEFHITNTYASTYCNYATSKTNSIGCLPALRFSGTPSVTVASPFSLIATSLVNNQHARLLYSTVGRANTSVRIGTYCIAPPYRSSTLLPTGGTVVVPDCSGTAAFDFNAWLRNGNDAAIVAGTTVYTQFRFDDPGDPARKGLTNAVEFTVLP
jgi:hypothetical protein